MPERVHEVERVDVVPHLFTAIPEHDIRVSVTAHFT
jgi:hypothetical protein